MGPAFPSTSKMWLKTMQKRSQGTVLSVSQPFSAEQGEGLVSAGTISFAGHVASKLALLTQGFQPLVQAPPCSPGCLHLPLTHQSVSPWIWCWRVNN